MCICVYYCKNFYPTLRQDLVFNYRPFEHFTEKTWDYL